MVQRTAASDPDWDTMGPHARNSHSDTSRRVHERVNIGGQHTEQFNSMKLQSEDIIDSHKRFVHTDTTGLPVKLETSVSISERNTFSPRIHKCNMSMLTSEYQYPPSSRTAILSTIRSVTGVAQRVQQHRTRNLRCGSMGVFLRCRFFFVRIGLF